MANLNYIQKSDEIEFSKFIEKYHVVDLNPRFMVKNKYLESLKTYLSGEETKEENLDIIDKYESVDNNAKSELETSLKSGYVNYNPIVVIECNNKYIILDGNRRISNYKKIVLSRENKEDNTKVEVKKIIIENIDSLNKEDWNNIYDICSNSHSTNSLRSKSQWSSYITNTNQIIEDWEKNDLESKKITEFKDKERRLFYTKEALSIYCKTEDVVNFIQKNNISIDVLFNQFGFSTLTNSILTIFDNNYSNILEKLEKLYNNVEISIDYWSSFEHLNKVNYTEEIKEFFIWLMYLSNFRYLEDIKFNDNKTKLKNINSALPFWNSQKISSPDHIERFFLYLESDYVFNLSWDNRQKFVEGFFDKNPKFDKQKFNSLNLLNQKRIINQAEVSTSAYSEFRKNKIKRFTTLLNDNSNFKDSTQLIAKVKIFNDTFKDTNIFIKSCSDIIINVLETFINGTEYENIYNELPIISLQLRQLKENLPLMFFSYNGNLTIDEISLKRNKVSGLSKFWVEKSIPLTLDDNYCIELIDNKVLVKLNTFGNYKKYSRDKYNEFYRILLGKESIKHELSLVLDIIIEIDSLSELDLNKIIHSPWIINTNYFSSFAENKSNEIDKISTTINDIANKYCKILELLINNNLSDYLLTYNDNVDVEIKKKESKKKFKNELNDINI